MSPAKNISPIKHNLQPIKNTSAPPKNNPPPPKNNQPPPKKNQPPPKNHQPPPKNNPPPPKNNPTHPKPIPPPTPIIPIVPTNNNPLATNTNSIIPMDDPLRNTLNKFISNEYTRTVHDGKRNRSIYEEDANCYFNDNLDDSSSDGGSYTLQEENRI